MPPRVFFSGLCGLARDVDFLDRLFENSNGAVAEFPAGVITFGSTILIARLGVDFSFPADRQLKGQVLLDFPAQRS